MSLKHEFVIINANTNIYELDDGLEKVEIGDNLILYINDSLRWLTTNWNAETLEREGMNYHGYTIIRGQSIIRLHSIINSWILLFFNATEKFGLKGDYLIDDEKYERNLYSKSEVLKQLEDLKDLCDKTIKKNQIILHIGI